MLLDITRETIEKRPSLAPFRQYVAWSDESDILLGPEGREPYRLLAHLAATMADGKTFEVIDIGTFRGFSAAALASAGSNIHVTSYDIIDVMPDAPESSVKMIPNVEFKKINCFDDMNTILKADFISCDVDPHDGLQERKFVDMLQAAEYKGVVLFDDIHLETGMRQFWTSVTQKKYDVSLVGHFSGSGLVVFDTSRHQVRGQDAILTL